MNLPKNKNSISLVQSLLCSPPRWINAAVAQARAGIKGGLNVSNPIIDDVDDGECPIWFLTSGYLVRSGVRNFCDSTRTIVFPPRARKPTIKASSIKQ
jgi:hypothetical protein